MVGVFDLFRIGVGPSSSHTVGPMRAAGSFVQALADAGSIRDVASIEVELFGSLAATGRGHGTFTAILLGLEGRDPQKLMPEVAQSSLDRIESTGSIQLPGGSMVPLGVDDIRLFPKIVLDRHSNALRLTARDVNGSVVSAETYFSVGGGFVVREGEAVAGDDKDEECSLPYPFSTGAELIEVCEREEMSISAVMLANELATRSETEVRSGILQLWEVMQACAHSAMNRSGVLPGGLEVRRRAPDLRQRLEQQDEERNPRYWQEWVSLIALAVNEENATGGRVVTAPTNGAAGIIPAVLYYVANYAEDVAGGSQEVIDDAIVRFFLAAAAIGALIKEHASISGAEVGCQGEVGAAAAMAAAGLAEVLGGTPRQVENAAEIAMEHSLGLTCDPIGGLVQIPCIERNAIGAVKAISAGRMALWGDGIHHVSFDQVIATMRETGRDMSSKYKETATGGLAISVGVNVVEC